MLNRSLLGGLQQGASDAVFPVVRSDDQGINASAAETAPIQDDDVRNDLAVNLVHQHRSITVRQQMPKTASGDLVAGKACFKLQQIGKISKRGGPDVISRQKHIFVFTQWIIGVQER